LRVSSVIFPPVVLRHVQVGADVTRVCLPAGRSVMRKSFMSFVYGVAEGGSPRADLSAPLTSPPTRAIRALAGIAPFMVVQETTFHERAVERNLPLPHRTPRCRLRRGNRSDDFLLGVAQNAFHGALAKPPSSPRRFLRRWPACLRFHREVHDDTSDVGTRKASAGQFLVELGITTPTAFAAPVDDE